MTMKKKRSMENGKDAIKCENGIENGETQAKKRRQQKTNDFLKHVLIGWFIILVTLFDFISLHRIILT